MRDKSIQSTMVRSTYPSQKRALLSEKSKFFGSKYFFPYQLEAALKDYITFNNMIIFLFYGHCTYIIIILNVQQNYNTSNYYGIIKGQMVVIVQRVLFFERKIPFYLYYLYVLQKLSNIVSNTV